MLALCGKSDRREFAALASDVRELLGRLGVSVLDRRDFTADAALHKVDFFLLLRSFPGEFSVGDVERLRRFSPLAPIAMVSGEFCEGEERTGDRFLGVRRFYANEWRERGRRELERFFAANGAKGFFAESPLTSESEYMARHSDDLSGCGDAMWERVLILSDDAGLVAALTSFFRASCAEAVARSWERFDFEESYVFSPTRVVVDAYCFADAAFLTKARTIRERFPHALFDILTSSSNSFELEGFENSRRDKQIRFMSKPFSIASLLDCARGASSFV